jgi:hypothetical protein
MENGTHGAGTPLCGFTDDQLTVRSRKARDLYSRLKKQSLDTCSYQSHASHELLGYLDLIAQEAGLEPVVRDSSSWIERLDAELLVLSKEPVSTLCPNGKANWEERMRLKVEKKHLADAAANAPKSLEEIREKLANLPPQDIHEYMDSLGVSKFDPLRPPRPETDFEGAGAVHGTESQATAFRLSVANWWKEQPEIRNGQTVPISSLKKLAFQCDTRKFRPRPPFLPPSVFRSIREWNRKHPEYEIKTFADFIARIGKHDDDLQPFRSYLSNTASRIARQQARNRKS